MKAIRGHFRLPTDSPTSETDATQIDAWNGGANFNPDPTFGNDPNMITEAIEAGRSGFYRCEELKPAYLAAETDGALF